MTAKTVAIYERTPDGMLRLGTYRSRKHHSIRAISQQFMREHPNADPSKLFISQRWFMMGRWMDGHEQIPFDMTGMEEQGK